MKAIFTVAGRRQTDPGFVLRDGHGVGRPEELTSARTGRPIDSLNEAEGPWRRDGGPGLEGRRPITT